MLLKAMQARKYTSFNPELQLKDTESAIKNKLIELMTQLKDFKFVTALVLVFKKVESENKTKYDTFYSHLKARTITSKSDIDDVFQSIHTTIISNIEKSLEKGSTESLIQSLIKY